MFSVDELFQVKQAGQYTLQFRFQLLKSESSDAVELVRFPALELHVVKP
jgi:hypothetical protein